ncbi:Transketolase [hydrothermal vent metagenome]
MIPGFQTWRGCDAIESAVSWKMAMLRHDAPTALVFSRQALTPMPRTAEQVKNIEKGGYVLQDCDGTADIILISTGSEVGLAIDSANAMTDKKVRVVSMPSTDAFDAQDQDYKASVLTAGVKRVAIEAGVGDGWYKYVGLEGGLVCMTSFGESAPADQLFKEFGFTVDNVVKTVNKVLA